MMALLLVEITALPAEPSRGRHNPRVVKRKMSNFPTKARAARAACCAPRPALRSAHPDRRSRRAGDAPSCRQTVPLRAAERDARTARQPKAAPDTCRQSFWLEHVRAWRASNLTRTAYCERHHLDPRNFDAWVARLRHRFRRTATADLKSTVLGLGPPVVAAV